MRIRLITAASVLLLPFAVSADNLGCKLALCFAATDGPESIAECEPPLEELRKLLERGKDWPSCEQVDSTGKPIRNENGDGRAGEMQERDTNPLKLIELK